MSTHLIFYPSFALFFLMSATLMKMANLRFKAVKSGEIKYQYFRTYEDYQGPEQITYFSRNFTNQFEMPVFFYLISIFIYLENALNLYLLILLWGYVLFRFIHTIVHVTTNNIQWRLKSYSLSFFTLILLWISFFIKLYLNH